MSALILKQLSNIEAFVRETEFSPGSRQVMTIIHFQLSSGTEKKGRNAHARRTEELLKFLMICKETNNECGGKLIKYVINGVLCRYLDPVSACKAALNIKLLCARFGLRFSAGIAVGSIEAYDNLLGFEEVVGTAVDRALLIQSFALQNQVLIDSGLVDEEGAYLSDFQEIIIGDEAEVIIGGSTQVKMRELSIKSLGLTKGTMFRFTLHEEGKLSTIEKASFFKTAVETFDVVGIGNTTFLNYMTGLKPSEYRDHIRNLLASGVNINIYCLDPEYEYSKEDSSENDAGSFSSELSRSIGLFARERAKMHAEGFPGNFELYTYKRHPLFHCFAVDSNNPLTARFLVSNYLYGVSRPSSPVMQFSKVSNPGLYASYSAALEELKFHSKVLPW